MAKSPTNLSIDEELKKDCQLLFADLGMDLSTAVTIYFRQALRVQGIPFPITRDIPNSDTIDAMNEYYTMKSHPELYKRYPSFRVAMAEVLSDA